MNEFPQPLCHAAQRSVFQRGQCSFTCCCSAHKHQSPNAPAVTGSVLLLDVSHVALCIHSAVYDGPAKSMLAALSVDCATASFVSSSCLGPNPHTKRCLFMFVTLLHSWAPYNCCVCTALFTIYMYSTQSSRPLDLLYWQATLLLSSQHPSFNIQAHTPLAKLLTWQCAVPAAQGWSLGSGGYTRHVVQMCMPNPTIKHATHKTHILCLCRDSCAGP